MSLILESVVHVFVGSILGGLGTLVLSIYYDFLLALVPTLQKVAPETYAKVILLLVIGLGFVGAVAMATFVKTKTYWPRALSGKMFGFRGLPHLVDLLTWGR